MTLIQDLPRVRLAHLPTPLEFLPSLSRDLSTNIWIKRDDCTGLAMGGNKVRKLEFSIGEALAQRADTLVTTGGYQSNHVRQVAAAAAKLGLNCHGVICAPPQEAPPHNFLSGNLLIDHLTGTEIHISADGEAAEVYGAELMERLRADGKVPFWIPRGASDALGSVGYVAAAQELLDQSADRGFMPDVVILVMGSGGTHAGMLAGLRCSGAQTRVIGVSVSPLGGSLTGRVMSILPGLLSRLGVEISIAADDVEIFDQYVGSGYGVPTQAADDAIRLLASKEGILLDPVYTGKAMAGLIDLSRRNQLGRPDNIVFLHTGGAPVLFVYSDHFWSGITPF